MARDPILALARSVLGFRRLRPGQREAVKALLAGRDVFAVMPTGSGKSAIYQLAALQIPGPTLVVSPLVALQRDQVEAIARRRLAGAAQANTSVPAGERRQAIEDFSQGDLEFLFLAPEQLANPDTLDHVLAAKPSLLVVDEGSCAASSPAAPTSTSTSSSGWRGPWRATTARPRRPTCARRPACPGPGWRRPATCWSGPGPRRPRPPWPPTTAASSSPASRCCAATPRTTPAGASCS
jgi:hypothetical protein